MSTPLTAVEIEQFRAFVRTSNPMQLPTTLRYADLHLATLATLDAQAATIARLTGEREATPAAAAVDDDIPIGVHGRPTGRTLVEAPAVDEEVRLAAAKNYAICKAGVVAGLWENRRVVDGRILDRALDDLVEAMNDIAALSARTKGGPANV